MQQREQLLAKSKWGTTVLKRFGALRGCSRSKRLRPHTINDLIHSVDCPESLQKMRR